MKKTIFTFLVIVLITSIIDSHAQEQVVNNGFEDWIVDSVGPVPQPNLIGWTSSNFLMRAGVNQTVFITDDAAFGDKAVKIVTDTSVIPPPFGRGVLDTVAGFIALGIVNQLNPGGRPFKSRPDSVRFWIKGTVIEGDQNAILIELSRVDPATKKSQKIADIRYSMKESIDAYTKLTLPFEYLNSETPDSIKIRLSAGGSRRSAKISPGNELYIDEINMVYMSSSNQNRASEMSIILVSPNPMHSNCTIKFSNDNNLPFDFILTNIEGKIVKQIHHITNNSISFNRENLKDGLYYFSLIENGKTFYSGELIVQ